MNSILKTINYILNTNYGEKEIPPYPNDFAIIDFSSIALRNNIRTEQNKLIYRYFYDEFGNLITKKYRYSKARVNSFKEVLKIPIYDKTKEEPRFPVFKKIFPGEVVYTKWIDLWNL